jgi:suppressor of tumorigenicity protein 13
MLVCKRAEALLKAGRPAAAAADATAALAINPDSAKGYKLRGKARRLLGDYDDAAADFGQAQRIDFDDSIIADLNYVSKRAKKIRANALAAEHNASLKEADGPAEEAD